MSLNKSPKDNLRPSSASAEHGRYNSLERTLKTAQCRGADGLLIK